MMRYDKENTTDVVMRRNDVDRLKRWIQKFRNQNVLVDINRITRYAIYAGRNELVQYLVEDERAKLQQKDKLGRSTTFYAAARKDSAMLEYIHGKMGNEIFREEMSHQDVNKETPWYSAVIIPSVANIEYCLAAGARPNDDVATQLENECSYGHEQEISKIQIQLLLALYTRLTKYLDLPVYAESFDDSNRYHALFKLHEMQTDPGLLPDVLQGRTERDSPERGLTWIHIPWTNVS